jgi:hypothetical protein
VVGDCGGERYSLSGSLTWRTIATKVGFSSAGAYSIIRRSLISKAAIAWHNELEMRRSGEIWTKTLRFRAHVSNGLANSVLSHMIAATQFNGPPAPKASFAKQAPEWPACAARKKMGMPDTSINLLAKALQGCYLIRRSGD